MIASQEAGEIMDIHTLIDKLEDLASQGRSVPLTRNVIVDEDRLLDIIDQMREIGRAHV